MKNCVRSIVLTFVMALCMTSCKTLHRSSAAKAVRAFDVEAMAKAQDAPTDKPQQEETAVAQPTAAQQEAATAPTVDQPQQQETPDVVPQIDLQQSHKAEPASTKADIPAAPRSSRSSSSPSTSGTSGTYSISSTPSAPSAPEEVVASPSEAEDTVSVASGPVAQQVAEPESTDTTTDTATTITKKENTVMVKYLIIVLLLVLLLFIAYIVYARRKMEQLREHEKEAVWDLRLKQHNSSNRRDEDLQREVQSRLSAAMAGIQREKDEAASQLAAKEAELSQTQKALQVKESTLSEALAQLAAKEALLQEMNSAAPKDDAADVKINETIEALEQKVSQAQADMEAQRAALVSQTTALNEKSAALAEKSAALDETKAQLAETLSQLQAKDNALKEKDAQLAAKDAQLAEMAAAATPTQPTETAEKPASAETENRPSEPSAAVSAMRKILMRKIESGQEILDLKGEKKGEILKADEWKEIENFMQNADPGFLDRLQEKCPTLTKKDVQLMMLVRLRIPSKNIASVYGINEKSIKQKLFVYKSRVGLENEEMSLRDYIETL